MTPAPLARPVAEQIKRTYPNRDRKVRPSSYQTEFLQAETREGWYPAPWYRPLATLDQAARPEAA